MNELVTRGLAIRGNMCSGFWPIHSARVGAPLRSIISINGNWNRNGNYLFSIREI